MPLLDTDRELARDSYYAATARREQVFPALAGDAHCDVAIVGGGLAGLSAAIDLRRRGFDVVLLEARELGFGASGRNGGQAIHGLSCDQELIEAQLPALRHRLRLAQRLPRPGHQRTQGPRAAGLGAAHRVGVRLPHAARRSG